MIVFKFNKLYKYDRINEPCMAAVPLTKGLLKDLSKVVVSKDNQPVPAQCKATSKWPDGSVRWMLVRFLADLPGNAGTEYLCSINGKSNTKSSQMAFYEDGHIIVDTNAVKFSVSAGSGVFEQVVSGYNLFKGMFYWSCFRG